MTETTLVHLVRHGEVYNPEGILYGRLPGFHLSDRGVLMAARVAAHLSDHDVVHVVASPLERVQETAAPIAAAHKVSVVTDNRVIESGNVFEGQPVATENVLRRPSSWRHFWNPFRPSWGEPYRRIAARMTAAVYDARDAARGHEAVVVSHQLPIWMARLAAEGRAYAHDPRNRRCTVCSLTSFCFTGDVLTRIGYAEPVAELVPAAERDATFSIGGVPKEQQP